MVRKSVFALVFVLSIFLSFNYFFPIKHGEYIDLASKIFGVDSVIIISVINIESRFNKNATSKKGAIGLMQLMPSTALWILKNEEFQAALKENDINIFDDAIDLYSPKINILLGTFYLAYLKNKFDDIQIVIAAYNAGEGRVSDWLEDGALKQIPYKETRDYLARFNINYAFYNLRFNGKLS